LLENKVQPRAIRQRSFVRNTDIGHARGQPNEDGDNAAACANGDVLAKYSLVNTDTFKILELPRPFVTPPDIVLPPVDDFGWPHGDAYSALLEARTPSLSTRTTFRGLKYARRYEALSMGELWILFALLFHPYVVDIREQYGVYDSERLLRDIRAGRRLLRTDLMTLDVNVTYVRPGSLPLHYHTVSVKHANYVQDETELRREQGEREVAASRGWTWELIKRNALTAREWSNYFVLYRAVRDQSVDALYWRARDFSEMLIKSSLRADMNPVLARLSRRLNVSETLAHHFFSVAVAYGFLTIDHSKELRGDAPIPLVR
jgi:hypothetical protein